MIAYTVTISGNDYAIDSEIEVEGRVHCARVTRYCATDAGVEAIRDLLERLKMALLPIAQIRLTVVCEYWAALLTRRLTADGPQIAALLTCRVIEFYARSPLQKGGTK